MSNANSLLFGDTDGNCLSASVFDHSSVSRQHNNGCALLAANETKLIVPSILLSSVSNNFRKLVACLKFRQLVVTAVIEV